MDRGAWQATVHGVAKSHTQLSDFTFTFQLATEDEPVTFLCLIQWDRLWERSSMVFNLVL